MRHPFFGLAAGGCAILGLAGCGAAAATTTTMTAPTTPAALTTPAATAVGALTLGPTGYSAGASYRPLGFQLVTNATKRQAENVDVMMTLSNAAGTVLDTEHGYAGTIRSGQTVGVIVDFLMNPSGGVTVKTVNIDVGQWATDDNPAAVLTATGTTHAPDPGFPASLSFNGTVTSMYPTALTNVSVGIVCYDGSGHISGVALSEVAYVPANGKATFSGVGDIPTAPARCDAWAYPGFGVGLGLPPTP
jgi:hypothetical protein